MLAASEVFDYVIVGAGAAGCVVASRLAATKSCTVCLLEAGPPDTSVFLRIPAGVYKASSIPKYAWQFETEPNAATANRAIPIPQGKTLGGSTAINGMNYNRGHSEDFDGWARRGNRGWGYADVLPYFRRTERRIGACDTAYRGQEGPLPITDCDVRHPLCDSFIAAACNLGLPRNPDYNGATQAGVGYYQRYIENGWRVSAARAFLRPVARHRNLDIRTRAQVTAVLLEGQRAVGVRYAQGPAHPAREVKARREVILAAGAANTPKLLQISGVGPPALLADLGIPVLHDLPGVGANLQDHYMIHFIVRVRGKTISGRGLALLREGTKWMLGLPSVLALSPSLVYGFANSQDISATPDVQIDVAIGNYSNLRERFPVLKPGFYQLRPNSRGFVRARSPDPFQAPVIQPNFLVDERDQRVAVDGIRMMRRLLGAQELQPYSCGEELPGPAVTTDSQCLEYAREAGLTSYHVCGTCQMGPRDNPASVVDDQLRVHGIENLRIADASIMPTVPSANTSAAVFMIGEKAADMILGRHPPPAMQAAPSVLALEPG
ncbi:GMC family oxidoreductase [Bradyrhizobium sp. 2TAF24]|uniref:GMC family oxidoreductase n=1 Tax=Bradyrhizobium sp. 2TAF24 TaxID=3233011 RepID=UPI003F92A2DD